MKPMQSDLLSIYLKEYESLRREIVSRLKEKNAIIKYLILLVSAVIAGIWEFRGSFDHNFIMIVLLFIIPCISLILTFIYNWHDEMIATLGSYIQNQLRPNIISLYERSDLLGWDGYLHEFRKRVGWKTNAILMRLIFMAPILISVGGYFIIIQGSNIKWLHMTLISLDALFLLLIFCLFIQVDRKYRVLLDFTVADKD